MRIFPGDLLSMNVREFLSGVAESLKDRYSVPTGKRRTRRGQTIEWLESRILLTNTISMDDMRARLAPRLNEIEYVTVVTHGWQISNANGDSMYSLAEAILDETDRVNGTSKTAWLLDYTVDANHNVSFDNEGADGSSLPESSGSLQHVVLLYDWAAESNELSDGWGEAAADALFSTMVGLGLVQPTAGTSNPVLHMIGHSFGTVVTSEVVERLAYFQVPVAHVTYLDPHDFDQEYLPDNPAKLWTVGEPRSQDPKVGYGVSVWNNVNFADTYYQTDTDDNPYRYAIPDGRPIPGAYNVLVNGQVKTRSLIDNAHSQVWSSFYKGTVNSSSDTGYALSPFMRDMRSNPKPLPSARFFDGTQDHANTAQHLRNAATNGVLAQEITNKRWQPGVPEFLYNGSFSFAGDERQGNPPNIVPGWSDHEGGHNGFIPFPENGNYFLRLAGPEDPGRARRTHNRLYIPANASTLELDFRDIQPASVTTDDRLVVRYGSTNIANISLANVGSVWTRDRSFTIPIRIRNSSGTLTVEVQPGANNAYESIVDVDNIEIKVSQAPVNATLGTIIEAFNKGTQATREFGRISNLVSTGLKVDVPVVQESPAAIVNATEKFSTPFETDLQPVNKTMDLRAQLAALGFTVDYLSLTPDTSGDVLRATFQKTWNTASAPVTFGARTGFDYFDNGVSGQLGGNLSAALQPISISITLGVDMTEGAPTFYVSENSRLTIGGVSITGAIKENMALRNLLDVDITGPFSGNISGDMTFSDTDGDSRLRTSQLGSPEKIVRNSLTGSFNFTPQLTANLPIVGKLSWGGSWTASLSNGVLSVGSPKLDPPSTATVQQLLENGYRTLAGAFNFFSGVNLTKDLPVVGTGLGEVLGLPSFLTGGGIGSTGFQVNVTPKSVLDLINGKAVDLIRFSSGGGDRFSKSFSVPIVAAAVPLGPIPLTLSLSFETEVAAGWNYQVGMGIDTSGFYFDPGTSVSAYGSIQSGLKADVSVAGILGMNVASGVGGAVTMSVGMTDPDPRDGKIYLDELLNENSTSLGTAFEDVIKVGLAGEAYGYARGVVYFLFWDWEVFNERFKLASFNIQLSGGSRDSKRNLQSQRQMTGRSPLSNTELPDSMLRNGVLTINTQQAPYGNLPNTVSVDDIGNGLVNVAWRGVGQRTYLPGEITRIVYLGNEKEDRFYSGANITVPIEVRGQGGNDIITIEQAPSKIFGGAGDDVLRGGSAVDEIWGGDGNDQIFGGSGNDVLHGENGNDQIEGTDGLDQLFGEAGFDVLSGGLDVDQLSGGSEDDLLYGGSHDDTLEGGTGRDILQGERGNDTLTGGLGDDTLIGGANDDTLFGGDGSDMLFGDRAYPETADATHPDGNDTLYGQLGDDRLFGEGGNDRLEGDDVGQTGNDLLVGDAGTDALIGRNGDDQLLGGAQNDVLYGGSGDDALNGNGGADQLYGDAGDDSLQIDFATANGVSADKISGGIDRDRIAVAGTIRQTMVNGSPVLDANIDDFIQLEQISGDNFKAIQRDPTTGNVLKTFLFTLDSSEQGDIEELSIEGLGGNDRLEVLTGPLAGKNIILDGGSGDDILRGGEGRDTLKGGPGDDKLFGGDNDDVLYGDEGRDELEGGTGRNIFFPGAGGDTVRGGAGQEIIRGGPDNDILYASTGFYGSIITGGGGDDIIVGNSGIDILDGEAGNDIILGGDLGDTIIGGSGDDVLVGELGRDNILGNEGNDRIYTYINNALRAELGLNPIAELTLAERLSRTSQLEADASRLAPEEQQLRKIENPTDAQVSRLTELQSMLSIIYASLSDLQVYQLVYIDKADGGNDNDTIYGSPLLDTLTGGAGDDDIYASGGFNPRASRRGDLIDGGLGEDTLWYEATDSNDAIRIYSEPDGTTGNRFVTVDLNNDGQRDGVIQELTIENIGVRALEGDDTITVDFGNQDLAGVKIEAGPGNDVVDVSTLQGRAKIYGGPGDDSLQGGLNDDVLLGDGGNDKIEAGDGNDSADGGDGNDIIDAGAGNDTVHGGVGNDEIVGGEGDDRVYGESGRDELIGDAGDDRLFGGPDVDEVDPGIGANEISSQLEYDHLPDNHSASILVASTQKVSSETRPYSSGSGSQRDPAIAVGSDGRTLITWSSNTDGFFPLSPAGDGNSGGVFATLYSAHGSHVRHEFLVNTTTNDNQESPTAAILPDGSFVIIWVSQYNALGIKQTDLYGQQFDASGQKRGPEVQLTNSVDREVRPSLGLQPSGDMVLTYQASDADGSGIFMMRLSRTLAVISLPLPVNTFTQYTQHSPSIAVDRNTGNFAIAWTSGPNGSSLDPPSLSQDGSLAGVYARVFSASGADLSGEFRVNSHTEGTQHEPTVAFGADGKIKFAWTTSSQGFSGKTAIYANWFTQSGTRVRTEYLVSGSPTIDSGSPKLLPGHDHGFVIIWVYGLDIWYRYLYPSGGSEPVRVNQNTSNRRHRPHAALSDRGDLGISWVASGQDGAYEGVFFQKFDFARPTVTAVTPETATNTFRIAFSERMAVSGMGSVTENWNLRVNGRDMPGAIQSINYSYDLESRSSFAQVKLDDELGAGDYELILGHQITDASGRELDGNGDGDLDDFVYRFSISARPQPITTIRSTYVASAATQVTVKNFNDRSYVLVWRGPGSVNGDHDIFAQRFTASGTAIGDPFAVNTVTANDQSDPSVAMDANGNFVIVWDSVGPGVAGHTTAARRFAADGTPIDAQQFPVNLQSASGSTKPVVAVEPSGNFVVTWQGDGTSDGWEIYARRFNSLGQAIGSELRVNSLSPSGDQTQPDIATDADGNFVVIWNSSNGTSSDVLARWYSKDGVADNELRVNSTATGVQDNARVAMNSQGEFVITWVSDAGGDSDIMAQRFDKERRPIGGEFRLNTSATGQQTLPDVSIDRLGNFVTVWTDAGGPSGDGISGRWFDNAGTLLHEEFRVVNSAGVAGEAASVSSTPDGEFVVSWASANGAGSDLFTQRYTLKRPVATGVRVGTGGTSLIVSFSQEMASSGAGNAREPNNWALQLPDGRWLAQRDANIPPDEVDPQATVEQFGKITQAFNSVSGLWDVTIPLNFVVIGGSYKLVARGSLQDAAGRFLDAVATSISSFSSTVANTGSPPSGFSSKPTDRIFTITIVPPSADIVDVSPKIRATHAGVVTIRFDQNVSGFGISDLRLTRDGNIVDISGLKITAVTAQEYTLNLSTATDVDGEYVLTLIAAGSGIQGSRGNLLASNAEESFVVDKSLLTAPQYSQTVLSHAPVAYWRLGESTGTQAADSSGNARHGSYRNGVRLRQTGSLGGPGSVDTAAGFDSVNDQISVPNFAALRSARFTLEAIIRIDASTIQTRDAVLVKTSTGLWNDGYGLYYSDGQLHFFFNNYLTNRVSAPIAAGQFVHVAASYDGTAMRLYFNGIVVASKATSAVVVHSTVNLFIGSGPGSSAFSFGGVIDEVAVYGKALTNAEIAQHYDAMFPATRSYSGQVISDLPAGYWRLGELTGTVVNDASGHGRNGSYLNGVTIGRPGALNGADASNSAAQFDSSNDYISIPDHVTLRGERLSLELFTRIDSARIQSFDTLIMKSNSSRTDGYGIYYRGGQLYFFLNHYDTNKISAAVPVDQFVYVAATYDKTQMRLYFNGQLVASKAFSSAVSHSTVPLLIGAASTGFAFGGDIDEVAVYNRSLSAAEVASHFAASLPKTLSYDRVITNDLPAAYWRLNEVSGTRANDSSGNRLAGIYLNGVSLGRSGALPGSSDTNTAAGFDSVDDQITIADHVSLRGSRLTLEAFVKINSATIVDYDVVLMKTSSKLRNDGYGIYYHSGQLWFFINDYSSTRIGASVPVDTFVHVAATFDGSTMRLYLNGVLISSKAFAGSIVHSTAPLQIGAGAGAFRFGGVIDDVAIYQRALTGSDVNRHFAARTIEARFWEEGIAIAQPLGYWRLSETNGSTAIDRSGNGGHGVYKNGVTLGQAGYGITPDTAVGFDGINDHIRIADSSLQKSDRLSLELVVRINSATVQRFGSLIMKSTSETRSDGYGLYYDSGRVYFYVNNSSSNQVSAPVPLNQYMHIVASYDGTALRLYVNGVLVSAKVWSGVILHSAAPLLIGAGPGGFSFGGSIDEVAIYNRGLSLFEVEEHYRLLLF